MDATQHIKGIITIDDIVSVLQEEASEDIQKMGGWEVLDGPYLEVSFLEMVKKRAGQSLARASPAAAVRTLDARGPDQFQSGRFAGIP